MTTNRGDMPEMPCQQSINRDTGELQTHQFGNYDFVVAGMTIREQFAMAAMQGLISEHGAVSLTAIASDAVRAADALLAELERTQ